MNRVVLAGYLADDPKILNSSNSNFIGARIVIAIKDSKDFNDNTHFINCVTWNNVASYVQRNLKRGDFVVADGRVQVSKFINKEGKKISQIQIVVDSINSPGTRRNSSGITQEFSTKELTNIDNAFPDTADIDINLDDAFSLNEINDLNNKLNDDKNDSDKDIPWSDDLEN
ncbi:single-stranded DNA-binding protein [Mycoplasmoides alvi]|uniref:single-stranded DNA-binding protein n=1 Tax=Mycoplasmoides alvi TaxID=78580 RepID=UPI00051AEEA9|nr:single-stranded DNA-binding protein [Mycoplasmoides alvi]